MTAVLVNLRLARKARRRADGEAAAAQNRAKHGRTKGDICVQSMQAELACRTLDNARLDNARLPAIARDDDQRDGS